MNEHGKINYVELPAKDLDATKLFFTKTFDWSFVDYGPEYTAFSGVGIDGGFFKSAQSSLTSSCNHSMPITSSKDTTSFSLFKMLHLYQSGQLSPSQT